MSETPPVFPAKKLAEITELVKERVDLKMHIKDLQDRVADIDAFILDAVPVDVRSLLGGQVRIMRLRRLNATRITQAYPAETHPNFYVGVLNLDIVRKELPGDTLDLYMEHQKPYVVVR